MQSVGRSNQGFAQDTNSRVDPNTEGTPPTGDAQVDPPSQEQILQEVEGALEKIPYEVPDVDAGELGPPLDLPLLMPGNAKIPTGGNLIHTDKPDFAKFIFEYGEKGLSLTRTTVLRYLNFLLDGDRTNGGNIEYKPKGKKGKRLDKSVVVLKRKANGKLQFSKARSSKDAVDQFRSELEEFVKISRDRSIAAKANRQGVLVDTTPKTSPIDGLTEEENEELQSVLDPSDNTDPSSRLGDEGTLQAAIDTIEGKIEDIKDEILRVDKQLNYTHVEIGKRDEITRSDNGGESTN